MSKKQRQHEKYWGMCWAIAFAQYNCVPVWSSPPDEDPVLCQNSALLK